MMSSPRKPHGSDHGSAAVQRFPSAPPAGGLGPVGSATDMTEVKVSLVELAERADVEAGQGNIGSELASIKTRPSVMMMDPEEGPIADTSSSAGRNGGGPPPVPQSRRAKKKQRAAAARAKMAPVVRSVTLTSGPPRQDMNPSIDKQADHTTERDGYTMRSFRSRTCTSFCSPGGVCDSERKWRMLPLAQIPRYLQESSAFDSYTESVPERCSAVCIPGSIPTVYRRQSRVTHEKPRTCPSAVLCPPCPKLLLCVPICIPCCCHLPYLVTKDGYEVVGVTRQLCCVAGSCPLLPVFSVEDAKGERLYLLETVVNTDCNSPGTCLEGNFKPVSSGVYDRVTGGKITNFYPQWEVPETSEENSQSIRFEGTGSILDRYLQIVYPPYSDATQRLVLQGAVLLANSVVFDLE